MRNLAPSSSSSDSESADDTSTRQSGSSVDTPLSSAPQSSRSSIKSNSNRVSARQLQRSSLKSSLKTSKSAPSLGVRFSIPEAPPTMPVSRIDPPETSSKDAPPAAKAEMGSIPRDTTTPSQKPVLRKALSKRFSAPAPASRRDSKRTSAPPVPPPPGDGRRSSAPMTMPGSRVTSFQSTASAPSILQATPSPSQPPSQYNPLQHYVPCLARNCTNHYTTFLLGPTFYSPQQPYQLTRRKGFCPSHANQDLKLANQQAREMWESLRQNAGRKTLGLIAAEFELYIQQSREERAENSEILERKQKRMVLGSPAGKTKGSKVKIEDEREWRYAPRPCTKKGCSKQWYSPFDNRLFLFYHTPRPSGFTPLNTLCPSCARTDVEIAEEKIQDRRAEGGAGPEWMQWCEQVRLDRDMEQEYWEKAQERVLREKGINWPVEVHIQQQQGTGVGKAEKKARKSDRMKEACTVM